DKRDEPAAGGKRAGSHRVAFAEVPVVVDDARELWVVLEDALLAPVARAVRNDDQLDSLAERRLDAPTDRSDVLADRLGQVEHGHDDAKERPRALVGPVDLRA